MRRFVSFGAMALFVCFSIFTTLSTTAQSTSITADLSCYSLKPVAKGCVGECGNPAIIAYSFGPNCYQYVRNMCVTNEGGNLCPSHDATAYVVINGQLVASGDITNAGSTVSFTANCGDQIKVYVIAQQNLTGSLCVKLGNLGFALRSN